MTMKEHLIETFLFNDYANKNMVKKINGLMDKTDCIKFFSHLINSQNKCSPDRTGRDGKNIVGFQGIPN